MLLLALPFVAKHASISSATASTCGAAGARRAEEEQLIGWRGETYGTEVGQTVTETATGGNRLQQTRTSWLLSAVLHPPRVFLLGVATQGQADGADTSRNRTKQW